MIRTRLVVFLVLPIIVFNFFPAVPAQESTARQSIYHTGSVDLNKNGRMDIYENPKIDIERRISDLIYQMTVAEKTCQTATLYGYHRVLKDELPTPGSKTPISKDGIAN